jgi:hypothetical protein
MLHMHKCIEKKNPQLVLMGMIPSVLIKQKIATCQHALKEIKFLFPLLIVNVTLDYEMERVMTSHG